MKIFILALLLVPMAIVPAFSKEAKKTSRTHHKSVKNKAKRPPMNYEDAKEICLINMGASIKDDVLNACIERVMKRGKF